MRFEEALAAMREGKKVKSINGFYKLWIENDYLEMRSHGYKILMLGPIAILDYDWEIVDES